MSNHFHDDYRESEHVRPSGWEAAWDTAQDEIAPSAEIKKTAETLVWLELAQQSIGWLLLGIIGFLLGAFGQLMSRAICLLSWMIFTLEAFLKYARRWAHNHFFRDVPCAYVPIHQEAAHNSLAFFTTFVIVATMLELFIYVPFVIFSVIFDVDCYDEHNHCSEGITGLVDMLPASVLMVCIHWISSVVQALALNDAMGMDPLGKVIEWVWPGMARRGNYKRYKSLTSHSARKSRSDRLLCLTWYVHMARHRHISGVVASAKPDDCGLPGHWFENVYQLKKIVEKCEVGDHVHLISSSPLSVSQEMALRALVSLAKQSDEQISRDILSGGGFGLLVRVVGEGKRETCRGLAAAAIAVLATQPTALEQEHVELTDAVVPLKRLAGSSIVEHIEVAYGALLNASLNEKQSSKVISNLLGSDGTAMAIGDDESGSKFVTSIIEHAHRSHTPRCQELAVGLLSCLVGERAGKPARIAMVTDTVGKVSGLQLCTALLKHGLTAQIKAGAAEVLAELAYWKDGGHVLGSGPHIEGLIEALVGGLQQKELSVAFASARALCSLAYNHQENKLRTVRARGVEHLVDLLRDLGGSSQHNRASSFCNDVNQHPFQRLASGISLEALTRIDEVDSPSHMNDSQVRKDSEEKQLEERVRSDVARALRILALNNPDHQQRIVAEGAIPLLINLLSSANPKVHVQAIPAVSALSFRNRENQDFIGEYERGKFFAGLAHALAITDTNAGMAEVILEKVGHATRSLVEGNESNRQNVLRHEIIKRKLEECVVNRDQMYKSDKTILSARKALEVLHKEQPT